jgi:hypothetical protein
MTISTVSVLLGVGLYIAVVFIVIWVLLNKLSKSLPHPGDMSEAIEQRVLWGICWGIIVVYMAIASVLYYPFLLLSLPFKGKIKALEKASNDKHYGRHGGK